MYYPILAEACKRSVASKHISVQNITAASIDGQRRTACKADFSITFDVSEPARAALSNRGIDALSYTTYQPFCFSPPAVTIATEVEDSHGQDASIVLSIWAHAHVMYLRALLHEAGRPQMTIPALPLVAVQGDKWYFRYFEARVKKAVM